MNEPRKLLLRKIDHAFAQQRYPLFFGISGMGKHAAAKAYAAKHNLACKTLIDELPDEEKCLYLIDRFNDERYVRKLCDLLLEQTMYRVCFISERPLPAIMYELMLKRIQLFPAADFRFSDQACQNLLKPKHFSDAQIKEIIQQSSGYLAAIQYHSRQAQEDLRAYWDAYREHCDHLFSASQRRLIRELSASGPLERESVQELFDADPGEVQDLINAGMFMEEHGLLCVPACLRILPEDDADRSRQLYAYHLRKRCLVRAWRCAGDAALRQQLFEGHGADLALMVKEEELRALREQSRDFFLMQAIILFRMHEQAQLHALLSAHEEKTDPDFFLAWLLCEDLRIKEWLEQAQRCQITLNIPIALWMNGFLKSMLWLPWLVDDSSIRQCFFGCLDETTRSWIKLVDAETAVENGNHRQCEAILSSIVLNDTHPLELKFLVHAISIRYCLSLGYHGELTEFPEALQKEICLRDDQLSVALKMFMLERALVFNDQQEMAAYHAEDMQLSHPYYQLCFGTLLYRLNRCEKAMLHLNGVMAEYPRHDYIVSHLKYVYALCLYAAHHETRALKLLAESLAFNGPHRFCSYYCFFGVKTRELMEIYIRFLDKGVGKRKKKYRKATDLVNTEAAEYRDYIAMIAERSRAYDKQEITAPSPLTPQEIRILGYIEEGLSNLQIAQQLQIKIPTVKSHISNIFTKLGVRNRASAISEARKNGYLKG